MVLLLLLCFAGHVQGAERPLGLADAVRAALAVNPEAQRARERVNELTAAESIAASRRYPTIAGALTGAYRKDPPNLGNPAFGGEPYNQYGFELRGVQPVFRSGAIDGEVDASHRAREVAALDLSIAERDLQSRTIAAFYSTILFRARLRALEGQLASQKQMLETVRERARIGRSVALDVLQIRTAVAVLEAAIAEARNQMETSSAELAVLIGEREADSLRLRGTLETFDWKPVVDEARASAEVLPELRKAEAQQSEVEERKTVELAKHWPSVDLVGIWGRSSFVKSELFDERATAWNFGVQVAIPLFSGLSSVHERRQLAARERQAQIEATRVRDASQLEQVRARKALETATSVQASRDAAFKISRDLLREANRLYRLSTIDYAQYLTAQREAYQAELDHGLASRDYIQAVARYMTASGLKLDALIKRLDIQGEKT